MKDLIDIVILCETQSINAGELRRSLKETFGMRSTHALPQTLPSPDHDWLTPYKFLAEEVGLATDLASGVRAAALFFNPVLNESVPNHADWSPERSTWNIQ